LAEDAMAKRDRHRWQPQSRQSRSDLRPMDLDHSVDKTASSAEYPAGRNPKGRVRPSP